MTSRDGGGHDHAPPTTTGSRRLALVVGISSTALIAQAAGAALTGSLALLSDTAHLLTDVGGLIVALIASRLVLRPSSSRRTWGLRRVEVLAALLQAAVLCAVGVYVAVEAVRRIGEAPDIPGGLLLVFGIVGLVANVVALGVLVGARRESLNLRAAFLEVASDALGSVAVIVASIVIIATGWTPADSIAAVLVSALIVPRAIRLLRDASRVLLEEVPRGLDLDDVRRHLVEVTHVIGVHDLHITQIASALPVITAHVAVEDSCFRDGHAAEITAELEACVAEHFPVPIAHSTFQLETAEAARRHPDLHP